MAGGQLDSKAGSQRELTAEVVGVHRSIVSTNEPRAGPQKVSKEGE